jgi:very-short-patch-repair endonuclease
MELPDVLALSERQHSLVSRDQLLNLGLTSQMIWRMRRSDAWDTITRRVLVRGGAHPSSERRFMAAVLDVGHDSFVSGPSSAALWKVSGFGHLNIRTVEVSRPREGTSRPSVLATVHEVRDLGPGHVTVLNGIPVSTPSRAIFELAACVDPRRAARACDNLWARNLTNHTLLQRMLGDWADHGRAGTVAMREILAVRPRGYLPPATNLESRFAFLANRHGIGPFKRQVDIGGEDWIARVDFRHERLPLIVEVQSFLYHEALLDQAADARRFELLDAEGFTVEGVWDHEIWGDPGPAMRRIEAAERRLRAARAA